MRVFSISTQLGVHLAERFLDRLDQFVDGGLAFFQVPLGRFLKLLQLGLGQFEERGVAAPQGLGGQGLEGVGQFLPGLVQQGKFLPGLLLLGGQGLPQLGHLGIQGLHLRAANRRTKSLLPSAGREGPRSSCRGRALFGQGGGFRGRFAAPLVVSGRDFRPQQEPDGGAAEKNAQ